ncbi:hypothetical protein WJX72_012517 [[Myrmecia] bisecta]|uniref:J domain-containing protein n=1 Tax=[Myrmecia] bisecta TaxID=41462 RepID=A0AAW1QUD8_9CHLO
MQGAAGVSAVVAAAAEVSRDSGRQDLESAISNLVKQASTIEKTSTAVNKGSARRLTAHGACLTGWCGSAATHGKRRRQPVHKHAAAGDWWQVLALEPGHDEAAIKRQYRKLAQALHPDKSSTVGTEEAFKLVGQAVSRIMQSSCGVHSGWPEDGAAAAWWEEWEGCRRDPHLPSSEPSAEESADPLLAQLEIAALRAEVVRRQAAVFKPEAGSQEQNLSATERQKRLRGARTVLAERLKVLESYDHVIAQGLIDVEGGFL